MDIDFDYETFEKYITESIGNPVELARNRRKIIHLNKFGYSTLINEYHNYGIDIDEAEIMAKNKIISFVKRISCYEICCKNRLRWFTTIGLKYMI